MTDTIRYLTAPELAGILDEIQAIYAATRTAMTYHAVRPRPCPSTCMRTVTPSRPRLRGTDPQLPTPARL
jgi:hypothetical protein